MLVLSSAALLLGRGQERYVSSGSTVISICITQFCPVRQVKYFFSSICIGERARGRGSNKE